MRKRGFQKFQIGIFKWVICFGEIEEGRDNIISWIIVKVASCVMMTGLVMK